MVYSPDSSSDLDSLGPFYRLELKFVQPLWTFGKLDALEGLAQKGLDAQRARDTLTVLPHAGCIRSSRSFSSTTSPLI